MSYANYSSMTIRASVITAGTSGQDAAVKLPDSVTSFWVVVDKTAEAAADNLFTVRLQAKVGAVWFDLGWDSMQTTGALATAADTATTVVRTTNIVFEYTLAATGTWLAHYAEVPSRDIRTAWVTSGTGPAITFSASALYPLNKF